MKGSRRLAKLDLLVFGLAAALLGLIFAPGLFRETPARSHAQTAAGQSGVFLLNSGAGTAVTNGIVFDGTDYVNTGVQPSQAGYISLDYYGNAGPTLNQIILGASSDGSNTVSFTFYESVTANSVRLISGNKVSSQQNITVVSTNPFGTRHALSYDNSAGGGTVYADGSAVAQGVAASRPGTDFTPPFYLGAWDLNGSAVQFLHGTVYSLGIGSATGSSDIAGYLPAAQCDFANSSLTYGFYDTASGKFITQDTGDPLGATTPLSFADYCQTKTVSFDSKGGSAVPAQSLHYSVDGPASAAVPSLPYAASDPTFVYQAAVQPAPPAPPTVPGYTTAFAGWCLVNEPVGTACPAHEIYDFTAQVSTDLTLWAAYAQAANTYTVSYLANAPSGADVVGLPSPAPAVYASAFTVSSAKPTDNNAAYYFAGWNTAADGSGTSYQPNDTFTYSLASDLTLYAQWQPVSLSISVPSPSVSIAGGAGSKPNAPLQVPFTVTSDNPDGFTVSLGIDTTSSNPYASTNALVNTADPALTLPAGSGNGTQLTTLNTWGIGAWVSGPGGTASSGSTWRSIPPPGRSLQIVNNNQSTSSNVTGTLSYFWQFGDYTDATTPSGIYRNSIVYTLLANP